MGESSFEKDLEKLEKIVGALEEGGLSLDDSLKQFELGIKLARRCEKALSEAEKRIEILTKKADGELVAEPFDDDIETPTPLEGKSRSASKRSVMVEERVVAEKTVEVVAERRVTELPVSVEGHDSDEDEEGDEEESGAMLF